MTGQERADGGELPRGEVGVGSIAGRRGGFVSHFRGVGGAFRGRTGHFGAFNGFVFEVAL